MTLGYMEYPEHVYSWTDYVTIEDLPGVPGDEFTCFIQATINNKADNSKRFLPPDAWKVTTQV